MPSTMMSMLHRVWFSRRRAPKGEMLLNDSGRAVGPSASHLSLYLGLDRTDAELGLIG